MLRRFRIWLDTRWFMKRAQVSLAAARHFAELRERARKAKR